MKPVASRRQFVEEEKLRILKMVEEKKITADEAARLLEALDRTDSRPSERELKRKWIHIKVQKNGRDTVNVKVPLALLKFGFKFAPHAIRHKMERAERKAERTRERAHRHAERAREKARHKLAARFGPDSGVNVDEILADALGDVEEAIQESVHNGLGNFMGKDLDLDLDRILEMAQSDGFDGKILDVYDEDEDEHVVIDLE